MSPEEFDRWVAQESEASGVTGVAQPAWLQDDGETASVPAPAAPGTDEAPAPEQLRDWAAQESGAPAMDVAEPDWLKDGPVPPPVRTPVTRTPAPDEEQSPKKSRTWRGGVLAGVSVLVVVGALAAAGLALNSQDSEAETASVDAAPTTPAVAENSWCAGMGEGDVLTLESDDPGLAAIAGLERAYYVLRDGDRVREYLAPDARVKSAEELDRSVQAIPIGTTYCLVGAKVADDVYVVNGHERRPDGTPNSWKMRIHTVTTPDGKKITAMVGI
jgi:hypothetical protein